MTFSPDGNLLASISTRELILWDAVYVRTLRKIPLSLLSSTNIQVCFSPDSSFVFISTGYGKEVRYWDVQSGTEEEPFKEFPIPFARFRSAPIPKYVLITCNNSTQAKVWDRLTGDEVLSFDSWSTGNSVLGAYFCLHGQRVVSHTASSIVVHRLDNTIERRFSMPVNESGRNDLSDESYWLLLAPKLWQVLHNSVKQNYYLVMIDLLSGVRTYFPPGHSDSIESIAFSPDEERVVSGSRDGTVKVWGVRSNSTYLERKFPQDASVLCDFSPDHRYVAVADDKSVIRILENAFPSIRT